MQTSSSCIGDISLLTNSSLFINTEIFAIPLEGESYLVYAPLRKAAFVANAAVINFLADLQQGILNSSLDSESSLIEFLQHLKILGAESEKIPITDFSGNPVPTTVTLFLTTTCNLRCTYCYASAGETPLKSMSIETAKQGIDFVAKNALQQKQSFFSVAYHGGGEPTTNWQVMTGSLDYARQKASQLGLSVFASSASNGVLQDEQIDWIVANLNGVSLSFDGLPEVHDKNRITPTGKGSSKKVIHTLHRFDEAEFDYGIRVTVTHDQIPFLPNSVEFICANFHPQRIQIEPAYQLGRWASSPSAETEDFIEAYREAQGHAIKYGHDLHYSAARLDALTNHFCGVSQDSFALSPDGNVSACYESFSEDNPFSDIFFYGKRDQKSGEYIFDRNTLDKLRQQGVQYRDFCQGCFAKWHCAGDCYHKSLAINGRDEFAGSERCHITRELIKDQILDRIAQSGGLFWHEFT